MNTDIEKLLRKLPGFTPPAGLRDRLIEQIPASGGETMPRPAMARPAEGGWLRRWWPALAPAAVSAACAVVLTAQQGEIRELKASNKALSQAAAAVESGGAQVEKVANAAPAEPSAEMQQEIARLKELAARLRAEIAQLRELQGENRKLSAQLAAPPEFGLTPEEAESMAKAKEKAQSIACINNLKQFGLAVRVWALDNNDSNPPNVVCMSNELSTPKILLCPADTTRQAASDFFSFSMANCSYEFLAPSEVTDKEPQRVLSRCPVHGHIGLCDGSVQSFVAKNHPEQLVERDGKVYYNPPDLQNGQNISPSPANGAAPASTPNPSDSPSEEQMKVLRERYGIVPSNGAAPH